MRRHTHNPGRMSRQLSRARPACVALILICGACTERPARGRVAASVKNVLIWPDTITLGQGDTLRLRALSRSDADSILDGRIVTWSTSDSSIVTVVAGLVTAQRRGSATIKATFAGDAGSALVNVTEGAK